MDRDTQIMLACMGQYGGAFVRSLADTWAAADQCNRARLAAAFPDVVKRYGPGSALFVEMAQKVAA